MVMESKPEPMDMPWSLPGAEDSLGSMASTSTSVLEDAAGAGVGCPLLLAPPGTSGILGMETQPLLSLTC